MNDKTIYLIGGTTEANRAALRIEQEGYRVVVSVATPLGESVAAAMGLTTEAGRKDAAAMAQCATGLGAEAIIDCSHPFALEASRQAKKAAAIAALPCLRYSRPPMPDASGPGSTGATVIAVESFEAAAAELKDMGSRALLTLGTRHLEPFVEAGAEFTARVLPLPESIADCRRLGIDAADIIAAWPPFDIDFNRACLRHAGATILVTKDSGREGGIEQKGAAAAAEGAAIIFVKRPPDPGAIHDLEELLARIAGVIAAPSTARERP
ncbi:MAG: precorrin-6A reductase [Thermoleophilia bacterium]